jgi:glyoxylase-like metal-dependent hydrolase (beta-lactamase superfamily II)
LTNRTIVQTGDASGNGMIVKFKLPSGLEIFGLPTKNFYGGHWDLGPTWNYVVMADQPFLIDSGKYGQGRHLVAMMKLAGIDPQELDYVLISHGHEDHDGGLAELVKITDLRVKAHRVYDLLIRKYPQQSPKGYKEHFPAKCWHCFMPESFYKENCLDYHAVLQSLAVEPVGNESTNLGNAIKTLHLPGHSPDCLAVALGNEALVVGDVVLPDITPWPTRIELYDEVAEILRPAFPDPGKIFGLGCYLRSLQRLLGIAADSPDILVLPAHRLFFHGRWQSLRLKKRLEELFEHHLDRSAAILNIVASEEMHADDIAKLHFKAALLKGPGKLMAANEIISHAELLVGCGDLVETAKNTYIVTGNQNFEDVISKYRS